jgi:hypothetical protein
VSKSLTEASSWLTSMVIPVHPRITASAPRSTNQPGHDPAVRLPGGFLDLAQAQLVVDHVVDGSPLLLIRYDHLDAVLSGKPSLVEVLLHREPRGQEPPPS